VGEGLVVSSPERGKRSGVLIEPCFPVTKRGRRPLFKDADGRQSGLLDDIRELDDAFPAAVESELNEQRFIPVIIGVRGISHELHILVWQVDTDRGPHGLELKRGHDVHHMRGGRVYIRDVAANGYLVPDIRQLYPASQKLAQENT